MLMRTVEDFTKRFVVLGDDRHRCCPLDRAHTRLRRCGVHSVPLDHLGRDGERQDTPPGGVAAAGRESVVHRPHHSGCVDQEDRRRSSDSPARRERCRLQRQSGVRRGPEGHPEQRLRERRRGDGLRPSRGRVPGTGPLLLLSQGNRRLGEVARHGAEPLNPDPVEEAETEWWSRSSGCVTWGKRLTSLPKNSRTSLARLSMISGTPRSTCRRTSLIAPRTSGSLSFRSPSSLAGIGLCGHS